MLDFLLRTVVPGISLQDAVCRLVVTDEIHHTALTVKTAKSGIPVPKRESSDLAQIVKVSIIFEKMSRSDAVCPFIKYGNLQTLPKKLGIEATAKNINDLKLQKANEEKVAKEILEAAKAFAEDIKEKSVTVTIKTGEGGKTFGSVSSKEIAAAYKSQLNIEIDKKKLQLAEPVRSLGVYKVPYKVHPKVTAELTVKVTEA